MTPLHYLNEIDPFPASWLREIIAAGHLPTAHIDTRSIKDVQPHDLHGVVQAHFFCGVGVLQTSWMRYPDGPCCYVVYSQGVLVYGGQTVNLRHRMSTSRSWKRNPWSSLPELVVKVRISFKYGDWAMVELRLIRRFQPSMNSQLVGRLA